MPKLPDDVARVKDFRAILDRKDIDAVVIATPDHWHAIQTIAACKAGKDVYIEKPLSMTIVEGRAMVEAARRNDRVVQVGTHRRSSRMYARARRAGSLRGDRQGHRGASVVLQQHGDCGHRACPGSQSRRRASTGTCGSGPGRRGHFRRRSCRTSFAGGIFIRRRSPTGECIIST